jgi:transcriptional regulator with XRE-family HTH domain
MSVRKRAKSEPAVRRPKAPRPAAAEEAPKKAAQRRPPGEGSEAPEATVPDVGVNLHILRQERGLTLAELSERSGVSKAMLNQIESGKSSPTIALGWKIANGLGVPFGALLGEPMPGDFVIHRRDQVQVFYSDNKVLCSRALFPPGDPRAAELFELSLEPGSEERAQSHTTGTREQIYVTAGQLTVECGDSTATLQPGDVLFFCADRPHRYHNPGREPTRFILVMLYPAARRARVSPSASPEHG